MIATSADDRALPVVFEDDWLIAIDKPSGLLSQPGIQVHDSVHSRLLVQRPGMSGPVLVHRLDMDTSGVMVLAKTREVHRHLQQQFERRLTRKRYVAVLDEPPTGLAGIIELPLRLDVDDRPRQIVCRTYGKAASTCWWSGNRAAERCRLILNPSTGRTHQLRVHMAHRSGLGIPIAGDRLYGKAAAASTASGEEIGDTHRLMLHAEQLIVTHPVSGECLCLVSPAPF